MVFSSAILGMLALTSAYLAAPAAGENGKELPWDGRGHGLTVKTITDKYLTHILTMRNGGNSGNVSDYVSIDQKGRIPGYNKDTGVINIAVDAKAIFKEQYNFRRSELVQIIVGNTKGTTFFRASVQKVEAFYNKFTWQMFFDEAAMFNVRIDASTSPAKINYVNGGTWDSKWSTNFITGTWYNFGIAVSASETGKGSRLDFYASTGNDDLVLKTTHHVLTTLPSLYELHIGLLTLTDDGSQPIMNPNRDILMFNGVSADKRVVLTANAKEDAAVGSVPHTKADGCARK
ncbi:unnamed protein product [Peronospora belbahrii]|uniref:Glycoside hydrolase 131 catalytic N-terminal domain-containing protein n=1 Tax=Peronospora belbahrii TaxID=622444 RepID=A0AAU9KY68_9STRA|nr:unnamed protein product [Peronospora belbahrii]CAH0514780.1 unnamed protein product [Peronospora belbahrii]